MWGCDETMSGADPGNGSNLTEPVWARSISHRALAQPLRADASRVYVSTRDGVAAVDRETGELVWEALPTIGLVGPPYVVTSGIVVIALEQTLIGLRASDGELLYERTDTPAQALTNAEPDGLFATNGETVVVSYDPETGTTRWSAPLDQGENVKLYAGSDLVCAVSVSQLTCFKVSDGSRLWSRLVHAPPWLAISDTHVIVAGLEFGEGPGLMALDSETGEPAWKNPGLPGSGSALSAGGDVFFACATECVAVRVSDGQELWRASLGQEVGAPTVGDDSVFVVGFLGEQNPLFLLDATSGLVGDTILPDMSEPSGFCGTAATSEALLFVFGCRGTLYAYQIR